MHKMKSLWFKIISINIFFCILSIIAVADNQGLNVPIKLTQLNLELTPIEKAWLKNHNSIQIGGPRSFPPFHYYEKEGTLRGISADYIFSIMNQLGVSVKVQKNLPWPEVLKRAQSGEIDLIPCIAKTTERENFLSFSTPYLSFPLVIITRKDSSFIGGIEDLHDKKLAIIKKISTSEWLKRDGIKFFPYYVDSPLNGLESVSLGQADARIENLAAATYLIQQHGLTNLKVAAPTTYGNYDLHIAVGRNLPELLSIINKALDTIPQEKHMQIRNKWLSVRFEHGIKKTDVIKWGLMIIFLSVSILIGILYWNRRLKKEIRQREKSEQLLVDSENRYRQIFEANTAIKLIINPKDSSIVEANDAACQFYGYSKKEIELLKISDINALSPDKIVEEMDKAKSGNKLFFNFPHRLASGEIREVEVYSGSIKYGQDTFLHSIIHDVTERKKAEKAIKQSEAMQSKMVANIGDVITIIDQDSVNRYKSSNIEKIFGWKPEDVIGVSTWENIHPDDLEVTQKFFGKLISKPDAVGTMECRYRCKDGSYRWIEFTGTNLLHDPDICGILGNYHDITKRKQSEDALEKRIIALTRPLDDPEKIAFEEIFNLDDIQHLQDQFAKATGVASIITHTDGEPITKASNFCRLCNDIIRKTDKGLTNCFKSDAILGQYNSDGPIIQTCHSGGLWDAGAAISIGGKHIANWLIGQVRDETQSEEKMRLYAREIGAEEETVVEAFREVPSMSREQFDQVAQTLFTLAKQISNTAYQNVQQARFISDLKQSDKEQMRLQSELNQAHKMESIGILAGGIAHDFNNILSIIVGNTELALDDLADWNPSYNHLKEIKTASIRAKDVVRQLLSFSRKTEQKQKPLDITKVIKESIQLIRSSIPSSIEIHEETPEKIDTILADATQIHQVLINLCTNASHAMSDDGGLLEIILRSKVLNKKTDEIPKGLSSGKYIELIVKDSGSGIDPKIYDKIFDPYFTTKEVGKGTGMGLAVVHGIVKNHKGEIYVESEFGKGTTFTIVFPTIIEQPQQNTEVKATKPNPPGAETILFVDDEEALVAVAKTVLERLGYTVQTSTNPVKALAIFEADPTFFDLVISDMTMPQMSGVKLSEKLRKAKKDIPIIICTGHSSLMDEAKAKDIGISAFAMKPITMSEIAKLIRTVLDK